jgi:hypothetical protein
VPTSTATPTATRPRHLRAKAWPARSPTPTTGTGGQTQVNILPFANNVGWATDGYAAGNFDTFHSSYSDQALAAVGLSPGASVAYGGITFVWPNAAEGSNDNILGVGQKLTLQAGVRGSTIYLLGASGGGGPWSGNLTLTFSDGSTQIDPITFDDWELNGAPDSGNTVVATTGHVLDNGTVNTTIHPVVLMTTVPANPAKTITAMTMPTAGHGTLHVFAITVK